MCHQRTQPIIIATALAVMALGTIGGAASEPMLSGFDHAHHRLIALKLARSSHLATRRRHARREPYRMSAKRRAHHPIGSSVIVQPFRPSSIGSAPVLPGPQTYTPPTMLPTPQYYTTPGTMQYYGTRYRTYDPTTNTVQDFLGNRRPAGTVPGAR